MERRATFTPDTKSGADFVPAQVGRGKATTAGGATMAGVKMVKGRLDTIPQGTENGTSYGGHETPSKDRPTRDHSAGKSPAINTIGGGTSAERQRKIAHDAYEDRYEDMETNIAHYVHHGDPKIKKKAELSAKSTGMTTKALFPDRLEMLKDHNIQLKGTQKQLESEIKIIATKFKRQIALLKKERLVGGVGQRNSVTQQFESEFNQLIEENNKLQVQEQELMDKVRKLNNKRKTELAKGKTLYSTVNQGMEKTSKAELEGAKVLRGLQQTLNQSKEKILTLVREIESAKRMSSSTLNMEELYRERRENELRLMQAKGRLEDIKSSLRVKTDIFNQGKKYEDSIFNNIKAAQNETSKLTIQNRTLKASATQRDDIRQRLVEARQDRDRLQNEFDTIMRQPFFKKQSSDAGMKELEQLQAKLEAKEREIAASKNTILKTDNEVKTFKEEITRLSGLKSQYEDEIMKMNAHMDPSSLTLNDVMKKLRQEDPSRFREVMQDLEYEGRDPAWYSRQVAEQFNHLTGASGALEQDNLESLNTHKERLIHERANLVTELNKIQKLLKLQVDLDKQNVASQQAELSLIQSKIRQQTLRSNELTSLIKSQNDKLLTLQEKRGPSGLTQVDLARFNQEMDKLKTENRQVTGQDADAMSEVSARTDESELGPQENLLDLRITSVTFDRVLLTQHLMAGQQEIEPSMIQTFLAVDFYNHDTKSTDMALGLEPIYNTLFSFKNTVDDFYVKYLERDTILVDIFYIPKAQAGQPNMASGAVKLGSARLPLSKLLDKDYSFQAQEIIHVGSNNEEVRIGKIFFRMRPRKPLDEAIKWYKQKTLVKNQKVVDFSNNTDKNKTQAREETKLQIIEIEVKSARGLRISGQNNQYASSMMKPFFTYDFYTFTHESAVVLGTEPNFADKKQFQVELTSEFLNYMKQTVFKIDFIDESIEMTQTGSRDYIGSARIPLQNLLTKKDLNGMVEIRDEHGAITGTVMVKMTLHDAKEQAEMTMYGDPIGVMQHKRIHLDVINKIAKFFSDGDFEEIDMYLDMLFMKDNTNMQRVTREMFVDFFMVDMRVPEIQKRDLEIFLRTHELLQQRSLFTRQELKAIFERPFKEARFNAARREADEANRSQFFSYSRVDNPLRTHDNTAFGNSQHPRTSQNTFPNAKASNIGEDDDFARATTMIPHKGKERESFGVGNQERATVKFASHGEESKSQIGGGQTMLDILLKKDVFAVINSFMEEAGPDYPGVSQAQTQTVLRKAMKREYGLVKDDEIAAFFESNRIGEQLFYRQTLMQKYGQPHKIPSSVHKRTQQQTAMLLAIKNKLHDYFTRKDFTMSQFMAIIDKNGDKEISVNEFVSQVNTFLSEPEAMELFRAIDYDSSHTLTVDEIQLELASVNASLVLEKVKTNAKEMDMTPDVLFDTYDNDRSGKLGKEELAELIDQSGQKVDKDTVDYIFRIIDKSMKGYVSKEDFSRVLKDRNEVLSGKVVISPEDLFRPLGTTIRTKLNLTLSTSFEKFKGADGKLKYEALFQMFPFFIGFELLDEEKVLLQGFLDAFGRQISQGFVSGSIDRALFEQLFIQQGRSNTAQQLDRELAKTTLAKIKQALRLKQLQIVSELSNTYQTAQEKQFKEVNIRSLKLFFFKAASLKPFELSNVIHSLDRDETGFIKITAIQSALA